MTNSCVGLLNHWVYILVVVPILGSKSWLNFMSHAKGFPNYVSQTEGERYNMDANSEAGGKLLYLLGNCWVTRISL